MRSWFLVPGLLNELDDEKTAVAFVVTDLGSTLGFMPDRHGPSLSLTSVKGDSKAASPLCFDVAPSSHASLDQLIDRACDNQRVVTAIEGLPSIREAEPDCIEKLGHFRSFGNEIPHGNWSPGS